MIFNAKSEPAVSPVIGTILLVAIAVILIAIILAVVMGLSGDTNEKKVGLNAQPESGANATLILYGGASIDELVKLEMIDQDAPNGSYVNLWEKISDNSDAFIGVPYLAKDVAQPELSMAVYDTRINVRGTFSDGTEVILLVQPMTFYDVTGKMSLSNYITGVKIGDIDIYDRYRTYTTVPEHTPNANRKAYGAQLNLNAYVEYAHSEIERDVNSITVRFESVYLAEYPDIKDILSKETKKTMFTSDGFRSNIYTGKPNEKGPWKMTITLEMKDGTEISEYWYLN